MKTILVADDNAATREFVRAALEVEGFCVVEACDGGEALCKIAAAPPDLVLLDLQMPPPDGFAVLRALRQDGRFLRLPVIALTAFAMQGDRERALAAGFDGYISKPAHVPSLRRQIAEALGEQASRL